jgi:hypothetical protein
VREPEPAGFGTLLAHAKPSAPKRIARTATQSDVEPPRPDDTAARTRLQEAKSMLTAATAEERQARRRWNQTQREVEKAQSAVEKAQRALDRLHD